MAMASMPPMDVEVDDRDDEETSPKTVKGDKKESSREKSEREYALPLSAGSKQTDIVCPQETNLSSLFALQVSLSDDAANTRF